MSEVASALRKQKQTFIVGDSHEHCLLKIVLSFAAGHAMLLSLRIHYVI